MHALAATLFLAAGLVRADEDEEIRQTVARVAYVEGDVSFNRGDDPDDWRPASRNLPLTLGDRVYATPSARVELQLRRATLFLGGGTDLAALNLTDGVSQLSLSVGRLSLRLRPVDEGDVVEVDTPNAAITFERGGLYRVDVDESGNTAVRVRKGEAVVAAGGGEVRLSAGDQMTVDGIDSPEYDVFAITRPDSWDHWVDSRSRRRFEGDSYRYVSEDLTGVDDLDEYGRWEDVPEYGRVWTPASVAADWQPYRAGRWIWQDPWGWSWVSDEPWGWSPYHYGRWITWSSRWYWVPVGPRVHARYSPAVVGFVGGGPVGGFVGWFPLAPRDPFFPWWGARARVNVAPTFAFTHRARVTVVRQNVFVSGGFVGGALVRDANVVRGVVAAPILRGPLPILPTRDSLHVAVSAALPVVRPPALVAARPVVTRLAPPPPPPSFVVKAPLVRAAGGAPIAPRAAASLSAAHPVAVSSVPQVRPVAPVSGGVALTPRRADVTLQPAPVGSGVRPRPDLPPAGGDRSTLREEGSRPMPRRETHTQMAPMTP
ncbi:MAG TPA: DUF6600 domain-containing protein, partial [Thermoanaerobaculia bacterium]|nr:DUF6600 domain-containing protein [Thermoanaerobaculia bacterium]